MKFEKTRRGSNYMSRKLFVALVGFDGEKIRKMYLAPKLAGYGWQFFDRVSNFFEYYNEKVLPNSKKNYLERDIETPNIIDVLVAPAGYTYYGPHYDEQSVPLKEIPYCVLEGIKYFDKRKNKPNPLFQGLQLIRKLKKEKAPIKNMAIYGSYGHIAEKELRADSIPWDHYDETPYNLYEYLRIKNEKDFLK